ncbi:tetratricopeptide repeat protein [Marinilabilia salmonicolor]|uniref:tetratricopeptide repeat protein n=1 Tax=Marinilabilia salmonicolor TaxID=989 RepID=UPI0004986328|nr:tetratricopeptide repeat protein [Marinilabilia salmonicolor]
MSYLHTGFQKAVVFILLFFIVIPADAGRNDLHMRTFKKAFAAAGDKNYEEAIALYSEILEQNPYHVDALTQLGICYVHTNQELDSALTLFHKAMSIIPATDRFSPFGVDLQQTIARTYHLNQQPREALSVFKSLCDSVDDEQLKNEFAREMKQIRNSAILLKNPVPLQITNLGNLFNSEFDDHSPLVSFTGDRIFFTSRRPSGHGPELPDGQYPEKVFFAERTQKGWSKPRVLGEFFSRSEHKSILSLSPDGNRLFLFKNDREGKSIYVSQYLNGEWQEPEKMPHPINSQWDETHAALSPDQSTLYFTSNRPGGFGGLDVYMSRLDAYGQWGEPVNMGPVINSELDEETPMLHPDGQTLYFASEGHTSMGRFDVFYSQMQDDETWTQPVNMGHPINTPDDDFFFVPTLDKSRAYYASYRFSENVGRSDIYKVEFDSLYNGSLAVIEGTIQNSKNLPVEQIRLLVSRDSDNRQVGDYRPNPATGRYLLFLESGENYTIKEVTPESEEQPLNIHVSEQLSYNKTEQIVMLQDPRMAAPLKPGLMPTPTDYRQLAEIPRNSGRLQAQAEDTTFTIQVLALRHYSEVGFWFFRGLDIESVNALEGRDGYLRYVTGRFRNREEAEKHRNRIQQNGRFSDAWIRPWEPLEELSEPENSNKISALQTNVQ